MINVFYLSTFSPPSVFKNYVNQKKVHVSFQVQNYNQSIVRAIAQHPECDLTCISRDISFFEGKSQDKKEAFFDIDCKIPFLIIRRYKNRFLDFVRSFLNVEKHLKKKSQHENFIIVETLNFTLLLCSLWAKTFKGIKTVGIVTDVPGYMAEDENPGFPKRIFSWVHRRLIRKLDSFVLLSQNMVGALQIKKKPFVIVEGQVECTEIEEIKNVSRNKVILYAGTLDKHNGVDLLIEGFLQANIPHSELHFHGQGPLSEMIREIGKTHSNILFFGPSLHEEILLCEKRADLLVNPRPTNKQFVYFSFPSKLIEYMESGTPVLTTRIPSITQDYFDFLFFIEEESADGISKALTHIFSLSSSEMAIVGQKARQFVRKNKSNKVQFGKIFEMMKKL